MFGIRVPTVWAFQGRIFVLLSFIGHKLTKISQIATKMLPIRPF